MTPLPHRRCTFESSNPQVPANVQALWPANQQSQLENYQPLTHKLPNDELQWGGCDVLTFETCIRDATTSLRKETSCHDGLATLTLESSCGLDVTDFLWHHIVPGCNFYLLRSFGCIKAFIWLMWTFPISVKLEKFGIISTPLHFHCTKFGIKMPHL